MLWNGCSHSNWVLRPTLTVTTVWNTGETGGISDFQTELTWNICTIFCSKDTYFVRVLEFVELVLKNAERKKR